MNTAKEDILLWESFRDGDREAFATLFRTHYEQLYRYGRKFTTDENLLEDGIQELFIELWQAKTRTPVVSVRAYLLKSLKYKLLKAYRKSREVLPISGEGEEIVFEWSHESFLIAEEEDEEKKRLVVKAVEQLSGRQKEIIYLKYYQNLGYDEVSEIMNINYQVARNLLCQAIRSLKSRLTGPLQIIFLLSAISGHYIFPAIYTW
ncbi:MAG TPA: sigma-70 family RNA polymerase sigma factor [Puia sp.]|nr:sigma-70 family RNA polymerase sigma factor [Puia sp.]